MQTPPEESASADCQHSFILDLDNRQNEVLEQLDALNDEIEAVLNQESKDADQDVTEEQMREAA